jgi:predicted nucleic acid-binding protein
MINHPAIHTNHELISQTLELFHRHSISFIDAYLCAKVQLGQSPSLYTFDQKLHHLPQVTATPPPAN